MGGVRKRAGIVLRKQACFAPEYVQIAVNHDAAVLFPRQGMRGTKHSGVDEVPLVSAHVEGPELTHLFIDRRSRYVANIYNTISKMRRDKHSKNDGEIWRLKMIVICHTIPHNTKTELYAPLPGSAHMDKYLFHCHCYPDLTCLCTRSHSYSLKERECVCKKDKIEVKKKLRATIH